MAQKKRKAVGRRSTSAGNPRKSSKLSPPRATIIPHAVDDNWAEGAPAPGHDRIAVRAYEIYLSRGGSPGRELEDWLEAERQLWRSSP
jgi:hypothetical protein